MRSTHSAAAPLIALAIAFWSLGASAQGQAGGAQPGAAPVGEEQIGSSDASESRPTTSKDESQINTSIDKPESTLPFRGSTLLFDQSVSTQTAGLETSPQLTYVPSYEWWFSFRPRYYFSDKVFASVRFDYYKEFTNSAQTTYYRENVFGDVWTNLVYDTKVPAISKYTKVAVGARVLLPTSKESQDRGIYLQTGATAGFKQAIPLNGASAKFLSDAHVAVGVWYNHPFSRATTPTNPTLDYTREDTGGRSFVSDQVWGATLVNHQLLTSFDAGIQITPKLAFNADMIFINKWHYAISEACVATLTGCAQVGTTPGFGNTHTVDSWFLASVDYELFDELTLSLGYYNLTNELGPDGQRRGVFGHDNIWWSPDARVFFDITANLDDIFEWASGKKTSAPAVENRNVTTASRGGLGALGL